ncbi:MAG TPA: hypothetical protein VMS86_01600, partial [Thermoanaerobaculia bacterium]|nr:hypothetical protein [Thermoanaerobaculia bacterium]
MLLLGVLMGLAGAAGALELRFVTQNDYLAKNRTRDDLFTFAVGFELDRGPYTISFHENAFTDREAGTRFDETFLTVGRSLPGVDPWALYFEAGFVHVGRGLFGQRFQNDFHRIIGGEELDLRYVGSNLHPSFELVAKRAFAIAGPLALGPRLEAYSVPGLRSHAVVGAQARWEINARLALDVVTGGRWSRVSFHPLEPHRAELAPMARIGFDLDDRIYVAWTLN